MAPSKRIQVLSVLAAVLSVLAPAIAGGLAAPRVMAFGQSQAAARVMLATVFDAAGRVTVDVGPDDFVIEEGNDERDVLAVQVADYPVALLLDNGTGSGDTWTAIRSAARRFIERIGQRPVALATLASPPAFPATFDHERPAVLKALDGMEPAPRSPLRPLGALTQAASMIGGLASPFSVVVILSAGPVDPAEQPDTDRLAPIVASRAAVHVIALRDPGGPVLGDAPDLLRTVAEQTRGQFVPIFTPVSFGIALDRLADQLSSELMIDYLVPPGSSGDNARIGIKVPGARVRGLGVSR